MEKKQMKKKQIVCTYNNMTMLKCTKYEKRDFEVLEKVQKKATKIIPEIRHLP